MQNLIKNLGKIDIYLLDQIMKGRYPIGSCILDAGCGEGRNLHWFMQKGYKIYGVDKDTTTINNLKLLYPDYEYRFTQSELTDIDFEKSFFDHIICNAVLHFATDTSHFLMMLGVLIRVLKTNGTLFIRMTSDIGIEDQVVKLSDGVYRIPDGSKRFLLTRSLLKKIIGQYDIELIEPLKTVNVNDVRCMSTLMIRKLV